MLKVLMTPLIFLDIDGVLNNNLFFLKRSAEPATTRLEYFKKNIDPYSIELLNELCKETGAKVIITSSWRVGRTVNALKKMFKYVGSTFDIIDKTPIVEEGVRGNEIYNWMEDHVVDSSTFKLYAIIDDDSDMLLCQRENFFEVDTYVGLTPNTCYQIKRFFESYKINQYVR